MPKIQILVLLYLINIFSSMDAQVRSDFYWSDQKEPHVSRRKVILKKYPEITKLYGVNPRMKYSATFWVIIQIAIALNIYRVFDYFENPLYAWGVFLLITYFIWCYYRTCFVSGCTRNNTLYGF
jgi:hypothetical protein